MRKIYFAFLVLIILSGCWLYKPIKIYPVRMNSVLKFYGFTIDRPIYNNWYLYPNQQSRYKAIFYREHENQTYSVYFMVLIDSIRNGDFDSYSKKINDKWLINDSVRFILKESKFEKLFNDSVETYQYYSKTIDKGSYNAPQKDLILETYGFIKKHPLLKNKILIYQFSERGSEEDYKNSCNKESKFFFNSVKFTDK